MAAQTALKYKEEDIYEENQMVSHLHALHALRNGEKGVRLPAEWTGIAGKVADAFNLVVESNERLAGELGHLAQTVGKQGKLSQRLSLGNSSGFWRNVVESVNELIGDLVHPTSE